MKIIDLLVKIANGEGVPKKIRYNGEEYVLNYAKTYINPKTSKYLLGGRYNNLILNDEVEIIEEIGKPKKIELLNIEGNAIKLKNGKYASLTASSRMIAEQQNEIAKGFNYLLEKSDKE